MSTEPLNRMTGTLSVELAGYAGPPGGSGPEGPSGSTQLTKDPVISGQSAPEESSPLSPTFVPTFELGPTPLIDYTSPFIDDLTAPPVVDGDGWMLYAGPTLNAPKTQILSVSTKETPIYEEFRQGKEVVYTTYSLITDWVPLAAKSRQSIPTEKTIIHDFTYTWSKSSQITAGLRPAIGSAPIVIQGVLSTALTTGETFAATTHATCIVEDGYDFNLVAVVQRKRILVQTQTNWVENGVCYIGQITETYAKLTTVTTSGKAIEGYEALTTDTYQIMRRKRGKTP